METSSRALLERADELIAQQRRLNRFSQLLGGFSLTMTAVLFGMMYEMGSKVPLEKSRQIEKEVEMERIIRTRKRVKEKLFHEQSQELASVAAVQTEQEPLSLAAFNTFESPFFVGFPSNTALAEQVEKNMEE